METYWVFHLAASWPGVISPALGPPLIAGPVVSTASSSHPETIRSTLRGSQPPENAAQQSSIRAAAVQMVFASRSSQDFITPEQVSKVEAWCGRGVLEALRAADIPQSVRDSEL